MEIAMTRQTAVRLPDETYERLRALSERTGRTATYYIREAIESHIDDLEDLYLAEDVMRRRRSEGGEDISLDELSRRLGLDD
jgi:RHH-type rel operon transcriptional repressor/antitoxin RelB